MSRLRDLSSEFEKERQFFAKVDGVSLVMETPEAVAAAKPASAGTASKGSAPSKTAPKKAVRTYSKAKQRADAEVQAEYDAYVTGACFVCAAISRWLGVLPAADRSCHADRGLSLVVLVCVWDNSYRGGSGAH